MTDAPAIRELATLAQTVEELRAEVNRWKTQAMIRYGKAEEQIERLTARAEAAETSLAAMRAEADRQHTLYVEAAEDRDRLARDLAALSSPVAEPAPTCPVCLDTGMISREGGRCGCKAGPAPAPLAAMRDSGATLESVLGTYYAGPTSPPPSPPETPELRTEGTARCAGCNVRPPFEHRCHGAPCPCTDCDNHNFHPASPASAPRDADALVAPLFRHGPGVPLVPASAPRETTDSARWGGLREALEIVKDERKNGGHGPDGRDALFAVECRIRPMVPSSSSPGDDAKENKP